MGHKCFISFKKEDQWYREQVDKLFAKSDLINKGLDRVIDSCDVQYSAERCEDFASDGVTVSA